MVGITISTSSFRIAVAAVPDMLPFSSDPRFLIHHNVVLEERRGARGFGGVSFLQRGFCRTNSRDLARVESHCVCACLLL